jgi:hypothetical protein
LFDPIGFGRLGSFTINSLGLANILKKKKALRITFCLDGLLVIRAIKQQTDHSIRNMYELQKELHLAKHSSKE